MAPPKASAAAYFFKFVACVAVPVVAGFALHSIFSTAEKIAKSRNAHVLYVTLPKGLDFYSYAQSDSKTPLLGVRPTGEDNQCVVAFYRARANDVSEAEMEWRLKSVFADQGCPSFPFPDSFSNKGLMK